jgi:hypothetical protein
VVWPAIWLLRVWVLTNTPRQATARWYRELISPAEVERTFGPFRPRVGRKGFVTTGTAVPVGFVTVRDP